MTPQPQTILQEAFQVFKAGNLIKAEEMLRLFVGIAPSNPDALHLLAIVYASQHKHQEAIGCYKNVLKFISNDASVLSNFGVSLSAIGKTQEALNAFEKSLEINPNSPESWYNAGNTRCDLGDYIKALICYERSLKLNPKYYQAHNNYGKAFFDLNRHLEALAQYDKALELNESFPDCLINKGCVLNALKRYDEAIAHFDQALSLKPDYAEAWSNKGITLGELKRYDEAIAHFDQALSLKPDCHDASWNKSLSLLLQGDFENGLPLYESRWSVERAAEIVGKRFFEKPTWLGVQSLRDQAILIYGEQGLGDFIQFSRYIKLVSDLGAKVILEAPEPLAGLMENLPGVSRLIIKGQELPAFDYQCPLLSLPLAFKTNLNTIPDVSGYINLDKHYNKVMEWKVRLGLKSKPRVGLVWSGNPHHRNDHNRSLLLSDILPFLPTQFEYISLQKEVRAVDKLTLDSNPHILSFAGHFNNFVDTAALIDSLDLVISVDTSVAHLSGALGKSTFILLPSTPDWRWLLDREDSPWYPSVRLYRQAAMGEWNAVLDRVNSDLNNSLQYAQ